MSSETSDTVRVFVAPCTNEIINSNLGIQSSQIKGLHDEDKVVSVEGLITLQQVENQISDPEIRKKLAEFYPDGRLSMWGAAKPQQINKGDWVIFARKKKIVYKTKALLEITDKNLAERIWGVDRKGRSGAYWEHVIFVSDVQRINEPLNEFAKAVGYKIRKTGSQLQGFTRVSAKRTPNALTFVSGLKGSPIGSQRSDVLAISTQHATKEWGSLTKDDIDSLVVKVLTGNGQRLEIDPEVVKRAITHLISGKHLVFMGPPGTGKTDLARRLLGELGTIILGQQKYIEAVASYDWGRYDVIGGNSLERDNSDSFFHFGCVTRAIDENRFLLIDEFNRADMNRAFGEMFLAIDYDEIDLREGERPHWKNNNQTDPAKISIPAYFRMICTMNDYDKSLLNELSYGLLRRFAFVNIGNPKDIDKERVVVIERIKHVLGNTFPIADIDSVLNELDPAIRTFFQYIVKLRQGREIGVSTSIDFVRYLTSSRLNSNIRSQDAVGHALVDYVIPQLDRLRVDLLKLAREAAGSFAANGQNLANLTEYFAHLDRDIQRLERLDTLFAHDKENK